MERGIHPGWISFGNTIKKSVDIARAFDLGVRQFVFDSESELEELARHAPGAEVFCRLLTSGQSADWPLSRKFGCEPEMALYLLRRGVRLGLRPRGVSFHVGSQQTDPRQWTPPILATAQLFRKLAREGVKVDCINLGGGFPAHYNCPVPPMTQYVEAIE